MGKKRLALSLSALHGHGKVSRAWKVPHFSLANVPLPQLVHAVGRNIMLTLTSLRNRKRLLWVLSSRVGREINLLYPKDF